MCFIRYAQFLGAIFFGTFCISFNRDSRQNPENGGEEDPDGVGHFCAPFSPGFCEANFCIFHNPRQTESTTTAPSSNDQWYFFLLNRMNYTYDFWLINRFSSELFCLWIFLNAIKRFHTNFRIFCDSSILVIFPQLNDWRF